MKYIVALLLIAFSTSSMAQQIDKRLLYAQKEEKFRKMKSTGIVMTIGGAILTVAGISMISNSSTTTGTNQYGQQTTQLDSQGNTGVLLTALGLPLSIGGIVVWSIAGRKQRSYAAKMEGATLRMNISPQGAGFALNYRFR